MGLNPLFPPTPAGLIQTLVTSLSAPEPPAMLKSLRSSSTPALSLLTRSSRCSSPFTTQLNLTDKATTLVRNTEVASCQQQLNKATLPEESSMRCNHCLMLTSSQPSKSQRISPLLKPIITTTMLVTLQGYCMAVVGPKISKVRAKHAHLYTA